MTTRRKPPGGGPAPKPAPPPPPPKPPEPTPLERLLESMSKALVSLNEKIDRLDDRTLALCERLEDVEAELEAINTPWQDGFQLQVLCQQVAELHRKVGAEP